MHHYFFNIYREGLGGFTRIGDGGLGVTVEGSKDSVEVPIDVSKEDPRGGNDVSLLILGGDLMTPTILMRFVWLLSMEIVVPSALRPNTSA